MYQFFMTHITISMNLPRLTILETVCLNCKDKAMTNAK